MINKKRITINAASSIVQIIVSGIALFILYRMLLETIGPEKLGVWSLVLAASSMVQVAKLGLAGSILKHIADYSAVGDKQKISLATQTAVISIAVFSALLIVSILPFAGFYFQFALNGELYNDAVEILPMALIAFWIFMVTNIYQGALYGCELIIQRNSILVADSISHLILCSVLAPSFGLIGLAYARVIQNILTLAVTVVVLKKHVRFLPLVPYQWNKPLFKELFSYAANFQLISLLVMLADPLTKGFLSKYGSVSMVGYYEMANKLIQLFRSLLVNANQVLVPVFARLTKLDAGKVADTYLMSYRLVFFITVPGFCLLAIAAPLISKVWIGHYEPHFIWFSVVLSIGWLFNTLSVPAYHSGLGTGHMRDNVVSHVIMTAVNILLILAIGKLWDGAGVVAAWAIALVTSGLLLNTLYYRRHAVSYGNAIPRDSRWLLLLSCFGLIASYVLWNEVSVFLKIIKETLSMSDSGARFLVSISMVGCFLALISYLIWSHPLMRNLSRIKSGFQKAV